MNFCFSEIPQSETRPPLADRKGLPTKSQEYHSNVTCMPLNALPVGRKVVRESQHYGVQGAQEETEYPRRDRRVSGVGAVTTQNPQVAREAPNDHPMAEQIPHAVRRRKSGEQLTVAQPATRQARGRCHNPWPIRSRKGEKQ